MTKVKSKKAKGKSKELDCVAFTSRKTPSYFLLFPFYFCLFVFAFLLLPFAFCLTATAQDDPPEQAPPPLRTVSKEEKTQLTDAPDVKGRTKLSLELMSTRLSQAEHLTASTDFDGMFKELGGFHGLLDNTLEYLGKQDSRIGKVLDNYKRLEIGLRTFEPRLETIRRDLPLRYEDYVRKLIMYVRDSRSRAVEPMFGNSVVPTRKPN